MWRRTFFGLSSTSVILEGSTMGLGLRRFSIKLCHWVGRPTKHPFLASNEVWTRCSKFLGADISGLFFFFLRNILRPTRVAACPPQNASVEKSIQPFINSAYAICSNNCNHRIWIQANIFCSSATDGLLSLTLYSEAKSNDILSCHTRGKYSNLKAVPCLECVCSMLLCWLSQSCGSKYDSKEHGWIWKHMCNEGYLVN